MHQVFFLHFHIQQHLPKTHSSLPPLPSPPLNNLGYSSNILRRVSFRGTFVPLANYTYVRPQDICPPYVRPLSPFM